MHNHLVNTTKQKMQNVSFNSVEECLAYLPPDELELTQLLRELILKNIPDLTEKLSYNVPYFKRHSNICFIWPASVFWGKKKTYEGVRFGFVNGNLLSDESNYLDKGERKNVYWKDFTDIKEIDTIILKSYLYEAVLIDEEIYKLKKLKN